MKNFADGLDLFHKHFSSFFQKISESYFSFSYTKIDVCQISEICILIYGYKENENGLDIHFEDLTGRYKKSLALFDKKTEKITINTIFKQRDPASIAGSIMHEFIHLASNNSIYKFTHPKRNWFNSAKVLNSAPYLIGRIFRDYIEAQES